MQWSSFLSFAVLAPYAAHALLRFPCSQLVTERLDPLVQPGIVSGHLHQIVGGNAFNVTMNPNNDLPTVSSCTTCRFKEDFSNYWTAVLFFKNPDGTFTRVPQMANQFVGSPNGGMTVYYIQPPDNSKVTAFKKGFRMIVGNPMIRNNTFIDPNSPAAHALTFRCWNANFGSDANFPHPGTGPLDTVALPAKNCPGGIRANIFFPSCWDGVNLDMPDHSSHVAYPVGTIPSTGLFFMQGTCPSTHPVRLPLLFMETAWDTRGFANKWPADGSQPFVYSMGDPTGYGQHADYVFGWQGDALQNAMNTCTDLGGDPNGCRALTVKTDSDINACTQKEQVLGESVAGPLSAMPGCNPIQNGPGPATMVAGCAAKPTLSPLPPVAGGGSPAPTTAAPAPTQPAPPSTTSIAGAQQTHYGQCGGTGYSGPSACQSPYTCKYSNAYYSQCL